MRKKILAFVFFGILSIILAGCSPGVTIGFNPEEVTIDLGTIDQDLPKEISFNVRFMGMGTLELKSLDFEMGIQDREGVLEGEDSLEFLGEIFNDLFSYLDDENPYRENGGYFFRQDLNITVPVLPFFGVEDEAEQLPPPPR